MYGDRVINYENGSKSASWHYLDHFNANKNNN